MHSNKITPELEVLLNNLQPHNQSVLYGRPTAPARPSYLGGARSYRGARPLGDTLDTRIDYGPMPYEWTHCVPWLVIYPNENHVTPQNVSVEVSNFRMAFLPYSSEDWVIHDYDIPAGNTIGAYQLGYICPDHENASVPIIDGNKIPLAPSNPIHAWINGKVQMPVSPLELRCVYVRCSLRLVETVVGEQSNLVDISNNARVSACVALDYYPDGTTMPNATIPMAASSRFLTLHNYAKTFSFATIDRIGQIGRHSEYKGDVLITLNDFLKSNFEACL